MESLRTDAIFMEVFQKYGTITGFLDAVFGFLRRHTEFYEDPNNQTGYDKVFRQYILLTAMARYDSATSLDDLYADMTAFAECYVPPAAEEVEIETEEIKEETEEIKEETEEIKEETEEIKEETEEIQEDPDKVSPALKELKIEEDIEQNSVLTAKVEETVRNVEQKNTSNIHDFTAADYKNGSCFPNYCWAQTQTDLELHIKLPSNLSSPKLILIDIKRDKILVRSRSDPNDVVISGQLSNRVKHNDVVWTINEEKLTINLDKSSHIWWERLFCTEDPIDVKKIDCVRYIDELPEDSQAAIQKIHLKQAEKNNQNNEVKKTLSKEETLERLRKAWNAEGSPFKGQPFDPSLIKFS